MVSTQPLLGLKNGLLSFSHYRDEWRFLFKLEKKKIEEIIGDYVLDIQHVGSTAIPGMIAKPILDIGIAINDFEEARRCIEPLNQIGYRFKGENGIPKRHYFIKGDPRTHHIHMIDLCSDDWKEMIFFRDYLKENRILVKNYNNLKIALLKKFRGDRRAYQSAKGDFIRVVTKKVKSG